MTVAKEAEFSNIKCKTFCRFKKYWLRYQTVNNSAEFLKTIRTFTTDFTTLQQKSYTIDIIQFIITPEENSKSPNLLQEYDPATAEWPTWVYRTQNISHFLLTFACSANFYIYFAKHSQRVQRLLGRKKRSNLRDQGDFGDTRDAPISNNGENGRNVSFRV